MISIGNPDSVEFTVNEIGKQKHPLLTIYPLRMVISLSLYLSPFSNMFY